MRYVRTSGKKLTKNAKRIAKIIDDNSITVNLKTTDKNLTSTGNLMIGGAFMGNCIEKEDNGSVKIIANQEINPNVLNIADLHTNSMGKMIMHELTEAYEGAKISKETGVGALPAITAEVHSPTSIYNQAHNKATPQNVVYEYMYDRTGKITHNPAEAVRVEWSVMDKSGKSKVIQSYP